MSTINNNTILPKTVSVFLSADDCCSVKSAGWCKHRQQQYVCDVKNNKIMRSNNRKVDHGNNKIITESDQCFISCAVQRCTVVCVVSWGARKYIQTSTISIMAMPVPPCSLRALAESAQCSALPDTRVGYPTTFTIHT